MTRTTLLGAALVGALLLGPLPSASAADGQQALAQAEGTTTSSAASQGGVLAGSAKGLWNLPGPAGPGKLRGVLRGPFGIPLFEVEATVLPSPGGLPGPNGSLDGVVRRLFGPNPGAPFAALKGTWVGTQGGQGKFAAAMLVPSSGGPQPVGTLKGFFQDAKPGPKPGKFQGAWAVKGPSPSAGSGS